MLSQAMREADSKQLNRTTTANGAPTFASTLSANLDFYAHCGNINYPNAVKNFEDAFAENEDTAIRNILKMRDVRGGHGVRNTFRLILQHLAKNHISILLDSDFLSKVVEVGRWDDLYTLLPLEIPSLQNKIVKLVATELNKGADNSLVSKWLPMNSRNSFDQAFMSHLRSYMKLTPKELRKLVVGQRKELVEVKMSDKRFNEIVYPHVPSRAMSVYRKAFRKHDPEGMAKFLEKAVKGEVKLNSSTLYPHEVLRPFSRYGLDDDKVLAEAQWKNLPDFVNNDSRILPMVDVSGSMTCTAYGNFNCMDISIALGLYISERNKSAFKDLCLTFDNSPTFVDLSDCKTVSQRYSKLQRAPWGGGTDILGAFKRILQVAVASKAKPEDMPTHMLVLTDMQYNRGNDEDSMIMSEIKKSFKKAGYETPKIIWWNLSAQYGHTTPVTFNKSGTAIVSGASPALLDSVLNNELDSYTPMNVMMADLGKDRYKITYSVGGKNG